MTALDFPLADRFDPDDWRHQAACAGHDPAMFFPSRGESIDAARRICETCPVQTECLEHALENVEKFGIWGGEAERTRRTMRRDRRRARAGDGAPAGPVREESARSPRDTPKR